MRLLQYLSSACLEECCQVTAYEWEDGLAVKKVFGTGS